jgi:hypothetical protein
LPFGADFAEVKIIPIEYCEAQLYRVGNTGCVVLQPQEGGGIIMRIKALPFAGLIFSLLMALVWLAPSMGQEEKKAEKAEKAGEKAEKAKAEKVKGDVGLLDTEKNYMILVTKEGKLITLDFDQKTKTTMLEEKDVKMSDVGLGSSADVEYVTKGEQKLVTKMEFRPAKGE